MGSQQPLSGVRNDTLVRGNVDPDRAHAARTYTDQPDANPARAAAYVASPRFQRQTETALRREEIPASRRHEVRTYFDALRGRQRDE